MISRFLTRDSVCIKAAVTLLSCSLSKHLTGVACPREWPEVDPGMLRWTCRHLRHKFFMVMQDMHPLAEWSGPHPDNSLVGINTFRNLKPEVHHGKVRVAQNCIELEPDPFRARPLDYLGQIWWPFATRRYSKSETRWVFTPLGTGLDQLLYLWVY